jgi:DNA polymerase-3 subunit chi
MTEISFHFNAPDRSGYACRILRKAVRHGSSVVVTAPLAVLERFDRELWAFDAHEFIAHSWLEREAEVPASLRDTTVWLTADASVAPQHQTLLNLGDEPPLGFESFERLIEVVSAAPDDRSAGRDRWKHYARRGYRIVRHEVAE